MGPAAALVGRIWPRRSSRGAARRLAARAPTRPGADGRSRRIVRHSPRGRPYRANSKLPRATRSSGSMAADAGLAQGRCTRTPQFTAHCPGSGLPLGAIKRRALRTCTKERVPRDGHAMLTPRSPRIADRSVVLRCYGSRCNRIMGFVLRRTRCNRLAAECGPLQRTAHRCNSCAAASRAVVLWSPL